MNTELEKCDPNELASDVCGRSPVMGLALVVGLLGLGGIADRDPVRSLSDISWINFEKTQNQECMLFVQH